MRSTVEKVINIDYLTSSNYSLVDILAKDDYQITRRNVMEIRLFDNKTQSYVKMDKKTQCNLTLNQFINRNKIDTSNKIVILVITEA